MSVAVYILSILFIFAIVLLLYLMIGAGLNISRAVVPTTLVYKIFIENLV